MACVFFVHVAQMCVDIDFGEIGIRGKSRGRKLVGFVWWG